MSELAKIIKVKAKLSYKDIPDFPISTVESHAGELIYGELAGKGLSQWLVGSIFMKGMIFRQ